MYTAFFAILVLSKFALTEAWDSASHWRIDCVPQFGKVLLDNWAASVRLFSDVACTETVHTHLDSIDYSSDPSLNVDASSNCKALQINGIGPYDGEYELVVGPFQAPAQDKRVCSGGQRQACTWEHQFERSLHLDGNLLYWHFESRRVVIRCNMRKLDTVINVWVVLLDLTYIEQSGGDCFVDRFCDMPGCVAVLQPMAGNQSQFSEMVVSFRNDTVDSIAKKAFVGPWLQGGSAVCVHDGTAPRIPEVLNDGLYVWWNGFTTTSGESHEPVGFQHLHVLEHLDLLAEVPLFAPGANVWEIMENSPEHYQKKPQLPFGKGWISHLLQNFSMVVSFGSPVQVKCVALGQYWDHMCSNVALLQSRNKQDWIGLDGNIHDVFQAYDVKVVPQRNLTMAWQSFEQGTLERIVEPVRLVVSHITEPRSDGQFVSLSVGDGAAPVHGSVRDTSEGNASDESTRSPSLLLLCGTILAVECVGLSMLFMTVRRTVNQH
jgi:hypothetical protein